MEMAARPGADPTQAHPWDLTIFDSDGVLVDSEESSDGVFAVMMAEIGPPMSIEEVTERFTGRSNEDCIAIIGQLLGAPAPPTFLDEFAHRELDGLRSSVEPVPFVREALDQIPVSVCVASSGTIEKMRTTLDSAGLIERFEGRLFSASDVARDKPAPDVYLYAARCMGALPMRCAVAEDSPVGVQAGVAAGMTVYGTRRQQAPLRSPQPELSSSPTCGICRPCSDSMLSSGKSGAIVHKGPAYPPLSEQLDGTHPWLPGDR